MDMGNLWMFENWVIIFEVSEIVRKFLRVRVYKIISDGFGIDYMDRLMNILVVIIVNKY